MNNIVVRTITGAVYTGLIVLSLIIHPFFLGIITIVLNFFALHEFQLLTARLETNVPNNKWIYLNLACCLITVLIVGFDFQPIYILIPWLVLPLSYMITVLFDKKNGSLVHLSFAIFGTIYITGPLMILNLLQQISKHQHVAFTLALFVIIWTNDTFAYLTGMWIGKHRMFERISPKKSWEGFAGGLLMALIVAYIFYYFFPAPGLVNWILFAIITVVASILGDFFESLLKRRAGAKDSGTLLPGHGGMLDRIDSMLFVSPVIFVYILIILK
jgi:phosphatidate cytidylyltransferase